MWWKLDAFVKVIKAIENIVCYGEGLKYNENK